MPGKKITYRKRNYYLRNIEEIHPYKNIIYLFNIISFIILSFLVFNFELQSAKENTTALDIRLPDFFLLSTMILYSTLSFSNWQKQLFKAEKILLIKKSFYLELFLKTFFIVCQMIAVYRFQYVQENNFSPTFNSYFLLLASFHLTVLVLNLVILIILLFRLVNVQEDPVKTLVYVTNPFENLILEIKQITNNYQVFIWSAIYLYLTFSF